MRGGAACGLRHHAAEIAATGVDYISSGAITHSAPNLDVALDIEQGIDAFDRLDLIVGGTYWNNDVNQPGSTAFTIWSGTASPSSTVTPA